MSRDRHPMKIRVAGIRRWFAILTALPFPAGSVRNSRPA
jgi:hypothetical protein